jgi:hypothetical protein
LPVDQRNPEQLSLIVAEVMIAQLYRDSFERWHLPTEQSFIIYEYQRMDGQDCQAVLAAAADGMGGWRAIFNAD